MGVIYVIEEELFAEYKAFIKANSVFKDVVDIFPTTPQQTIKFPIIIMQEINNYDYMLGKSFDRTESVNTISYRVSIFTKPITIGSTKYQPKQVINELRGLTSKFFNNVGLNKDSDTPVDNISQDITRREMIFSGRIANWNNSLYF
jgi:hypothetical protein